MHLWTPVKSVVISGVRERCAYPVLMVAPIISTAAWNAKMYNIFLFTKRMKRYVRGRIMVLDPTSLFCERWVLSWNGLRMFTMKRFESFYKSLNVITQIKQILYQSDMSVFEIGIWKTCLEVFQKLWRKSWIRRNMKGKEGNILFNDLKEYSSIWMGNWLGTFKSSFCYKVEHV